MITITLKPLYANVLRIRIRFQLSSQSVDCGSYKLYLSVCLSVTLLRLISRLLWVRFWSNLMNMLELWSVWLYQNFINLPTRTCRTGYWGRRDLIDITHWTTNLITAEKWTVRVPIFILPRHSIEPCTYELSASECWQVSVLTKCATEGAPWIQSEHICFSSKAFISDRIKNKAYNKSPNEEWNPGLNQKLGLERLSGWNKPLAVSDVLDQSQTD